MPDYLRANVARCEIIGDAQVEKASGRVYVNTQALSCFDKTGDSSVQAKFVGYLVGTDNKLGLATQDIVAYAGATVVVVRSGELEFAKLP